MINDPVYIYSDELLLAGIRSRNERVLAYLQREYRTRLVYFVMNLSLTYEEAEEIVAESFVKLWEHRSEMISVKHVQNFLYSVSRNSAFNLLTQKQRQSALLEKYSAVQEMQGGATAAVFNDRVESEMLQLLHTATKQLPEECRRIFELYLEDYKPDEIAQKLAITAATVRSQKRRAVALIKKWLKEKLPGLAFLLFFCCPF